MPQSLCSFRCKLFNSSIFRLYQGWCQCQASFSSDSILRNFNTKGRRCQYGHAAGSFPVSVNFFRQLRMLRLEFAGRKAYHGGNFSNILKSVFCGAVFYFAVGQLWHTNQLFRVLCASRALSLKSVAVNFGTQIGFFEFCVPGRLCLRKF